jgi:hypothetical protein
MERGAARHAMAAREVALAHARAQPGDRHRRRRAHVVRAQHLKQALREAREFGVELELHARRQETERLDQALDVGVGDLDALHSQAARDLRMRSREFAGGLAHVGELLVVVVQQVRVHGDPLTGLSAQRTGWISRVGCVGWVGWV